MARRNYGKGTVRQEPNGKWTAIWPIGGGKRKSKGGLKSRADALAINAIQLAVLYSRRTGLPVPATVLPTLGSRAEAFFERRAKTHAAAYNDQMKWRKHQAATFAHLRPDQVTTAVIRQWQRDMTAAGQSGGSIRVMLAVLSGMFNELQEEEIWDRNPCKGLPASLRAAMRSTHDPASVPYLQRWEDVMSVFEALPSPTHRMFALGAMAGLRPAEARALRWPDVDLPHGLLFVRRQAPRKHGLGTRMVKDKRARAVPILPVLATYLQRWHGEDDGQGLVVKPRPSGKGEFLYCGGPPRELAEVLTQLGLAVPNRGWYECTRHTFASHWVLDGGTLEELQAVLGHSSITITEMYAHLKTARFAAVPREHLGRGHLLSTTAHVTESVARIIPMGVTLAGKS